MEDYSREVAVCSVGRRKQCSICFFVVFFLHAGRVVFCPGWVVYRPNVGSESASIPVEVGDLKIEDGRLTV